MADIRRVIGIDLGTTNSCVAAVVGGYPQVIPNAHGYKTTPSVVAFMEDGKLLIGQHAKRQALINPSNTIYSAKRLIGRKWDSAETKRARSVYPFTIEAGEAGEVLIRQGDRLLPVQQVSAKILEELRKVACAFLVDDVWDAVITVPAYFNDSQRQATKEAGELAGLNVLRIINEPTAAALAYGHAQKRNATIAVYDLGGGTFDISVLEIKDGVFKVLATAGDTFLGGDDFDNRIIDHLAEQFLEENDIDLRRDRTSLQRLKDAAEQAKCELSLLKQVRITLPFITQGKKGASHLEMTLTRDDLDRLCMDLIERTLKTCKSVLDDAKIDKADIDDVLLVGGQTRMPRISDSVSNFFGRSASKQIHPEEAVAIGAAIHADSLVEASSETLLLDVTPLSLGIRTAGGVFTPLIAKNSTVPISQAHTFTTVSDQQKSANIQVYQGESPFAVENELLGEFLLSGVRQAKAGEPEIEVEFSIDANGIVHVSATDLDTGLEQSITLTTGEDADEVGYAHADNEAFEVKLAHQSKTDELKQELRLSLHRLRKQYEAKGQNLANDLQKRILSILDHGPGFIQGDDGNAMTKLKREIQRVLQRFD